MREEGTSKPLSRRGAVGVGTVLALANLVGAVVTFYVVGSWPSEQDATGDYVDMADVGFLFAGGLCVQVAINGLVLLPWRRTRWIGVGALVAAALVVAAYFAFVFILLVAIGS